MDKEETNKILKAKGIFCDSDTDEYIDTFRKTYQDKMNKFDEEDFYHSMMNWFFDGSTGASYYDSWLRKNWSDN